MQILGLDPGASSTGFARVSITDNREIKPEEYGTISIIEAHFLDTYKWIIAYIAQHAIQLIGYEIAFFGKQNFQPPPEKIATVQVQGIIELIGEEYGVSVQSWNAVSVRSSICGGNAKKPQVRTAIQKLLHMPTAIKDKDAVDALAVACCTASRMYGARWPVRGFQEPLQFAPPKKKKKKVDISQLTDEQIQLLASQNRLIYDGNKIAGVKP